MEVFHHYEFVFSQDQLAILAAESQSWASPGSGSSIKAGKVVTEQPGLWGARVWKCFGRAK